MISDGKTDEDESTIKTRQILDKIQIPVILKVYISPHCPFCPTAVSSVFKLIGLSRMIYAEIIDVELFSELAEKDHIRSVPTVILDDQFRWTGSVNIQEIIDMMIRFDPSKLSEKTFQKMIEEGNAQGLANMMAQSNAVYPGFIKLLIHPGWPVRLGAMAVFEYLEGISPVLAEETRLKLLDFFEPADDQVKGDIAYLLGGSNHSNILAKLQYIINGPYAAEVREAAKEALESIDLSCLV
jgi:hypothetical protein